MAVNDETVLRDFTRARIADSDVVLEVLTITWHAGPHSPESTWVEVARLARATAEADLGRWRRRLLQRRRFFRICSACAERKPVGWMFDQRICQRCAERTMGVVF